MLHFSLAAAAYRDPAARTSELRVRCASGASNHDDYPAATVLPPPWASAFDVHAWVKDYNAALMARPMNSTRLWELRESSSSNVNGSFSLPRRFDQEWFAFLQVKLRMLEALEERAGLHDLWRPGRSLLDVGGGHGMLAAYLMARHGVHVQAFDVANSYQCDEIAASRLKVHFFDGVSLPFRNRSVDAVSFMSVLHHAANQTESLLREAARISRRWIIILEDTQTPAVAARNAKHDASGIFRTDAQWKEVFQRVAGFSLSRDGYVGAALVRHGYTIGVEGDEWRCFLKWYVLEARSTSAPQSADKAPAQPSAVKYLNRKCVSVPA
ncbi:hypothetical protein AB1Y20_010286 [Prymnesium parvum]|uniref:Methyltransferase type 11 domain-containing protein n=1 Tax=Prymnesium parvum TaxID=97485 RepID=A0AB34K4E3_PRYPA